MSFPDRLLPLRRAAALIAALLLAGCTPQGGLSIFRSSAPTVIAGTPFPTYAGVVNPGVTNVPVFTPSIPTPTPRPGATSPPVNTGGWTQLANGVEQRNLSMNTAQGAINVVAVRIDPARMAFAAYYTPGELHSLSEWRGALPTAFFLVNGNYFDPSNKAVGLVISNSNNYQGYINRADSGLFQVQNGAPRVRSLWLEPYNAQTERLEQAVQGFPILAARGQAAPIAQDYNQQPSRRTVVANDRTGRILFIITPIGGCTLTEMANWLVSASGLDIDMALNLDGGRSTQMVVGNQTYVGLANIPMMIVGFTR
jgi:uncharacterized protein YigE (DUF2233 family)